MKKFVKHISALSVCLVFLAMSFFHGACGGETGGGGTDGTLTAPDLTTIRTALGLNNPFGMVPGLALGAITLPECTTTGSPTLTYSITGLPAWLAFDATTRALALAEGTTVVPQEANTAAEVTYTCTEDSTTTSAAAMLTKAAGDSASATFTVNDLDGGGVVDGREYEFGEVPLLNSGMGWMWLTPGIVDLYRTTTAEKMPTGVIVTGVGMDPTDAADDTSDFDGDATNNGDEITNGTNIFVATSAGTFAGSASSAGQNPKGITTADLDNDGDLDIIVTSTAGGGAIRPHLNNGSGTFTAGLDYSTQTGPEGLAAADFNGDGNMDIAANNTGSSSVSVLLGNGDGTFGTQTPYTVGAVPENIVAADFNGDGNVDLATANATPDNVSILLGAGNGTFGTAQNFAAGTEPSDLAFADFDLDGDLDLAVSNLVGTSVSILTNNGSGSFTLTASLIPQDEPRSVTTADFNGDGAIDIAALVWTGIGTQNINLFLNNGDGTFANYTVVPFDNKPYVVVAADLDGDGNVDLAATANSGNLVGVFLSNGDGTFAGVVNYTVDTGPWGIVAADLNGNGKVDLANANNGNDTFSVLLNQ